MGVEVKKLYGVAHAASLEFIVYGTQVYLKPSLELLKELSQLPAGTKVGIEIFTPQENTELKSLVINGVKIKPDPASGRYWNLLVEHCKKSNLNVVPLDDSVFFKDHAKHAVLAHELLVKQQKTKSNVKYEKLWHEIYTHRVEAQHILTIQREEGFFQKIKELQPEIVILGKGHTDYFWAKPEIAGRHGIKFNAYGAEETLDLRFLEDKFMFCMSESETLNGESSAEFISEDVPPNPFVNNPTVDINNNKRIAERVRVERTYNALKTGRITQDKPNYIGTWNLNTPAEGLFELFIKEQNEDKIKGTIEDIFGTANFQGRLENNEIVFIKEYNKSATQIGGEGGNLEYMAAKKNGKFEGHYSYSSGSRVPFEMIPFQDGMKYNVVPEKEKNKRKLARTQPNPSA